MDKYFMFDKIFFLCVKFFKMYLIERYFLLWEVCRSDLFIC